MTKALLEKLRKEHREQMIDIFNKNAEWYKRFADKISKGELLTDNDWKDMNDETLIDVSYIDECGNSCYTAINYIFGKEIEDECEE